MRSMRVGALALALPVLALVGLPGCATYGDGDFVTRCGGSLFFRGFDADATHEVVVEIPAGWLEEAVASPVDLVKTVGFPSTAVRASFLVGQDLDSIDLDYCTDFGSPPPIDQTLTAAAGSAEVVLHPAAYWREVTADLTLSEVRMEDSDSTVTIADFSMKDAPVGRHV